MPYSPITNSCLLNSYCVFEGHAKKRICKAANSFHFGNKYQEVFCCLKCNECFQMDFDDFIKIHGDHLSFLDRKKKRQMLKTFKKSVHSNVQTVAAAATVHSNNPPTEEEDAPNFPSVAASLKITLESHADFFNQFPEVQQDPQTQTISTQTSFKDVPPKDHEDTPPSVIESRLEVLESNISILLNQNQRLIEMLHESDKDRRNEFQHLNYCMQRDLHKVNKVVAGLLQSNERLEANYKRAISTLTYREAAKVPDLVISPPVTCPQKRTHKVSQVEVKSGARLLPPLDSYSPKRIRIVDLGQQQEQQQQHPNQSESPHQSNVDIAWTMSNVFGDSD